MMFLRMLAIVLTGLAVTGAADARIQAQMFCWVSDVEFPIACAEDEDGDDEDDEDEAGYAPGQPGDA